MKIKDGFVLRSVMGNNVVIAVGEASKNFRGIVQLNESAAEIWKHISEGKTRDEICDLMFDKYEVEREALGRDVDKVIAMLCDNGLVEL